MAFYVNQIPSKMMEKIYGPGKYKHMKDVILTEYGSFENLEKQARQQGNSEAKAHLSGAYQEGIAELNVEKDLDKAIGWMEASLDASNYPFPTNVLVLGTLYDQKDTVASQLRAHQLYHQAARLGSVRAELNLAESYRCGIEGVVDVDIEEAFKWFKRAADEEVVDVKNLPEKVLFTRGTLRKLEFDVKLEVLSLLHKYYLCGDCPEGKPQQLKAIYYLKKAAELGHVDSQFELGSTYLQGSSEVPKNLQEARRWFEKAARGGHQESKEILQKLSEQDAVVPVAAQTNNDQEHKKNVFHQCFDIFKEQLERSKNHPFLIDNQMFYTDESVFTRFPDSPTAQCYLRAYQKARDGLQKLKEGNFKEAVKLMAHSYLYENTMLNTFPEMKNEHTIINIIGMIFEELKVNSKFFEGLLLLIALHNAPVESSNTNFKSFKTDTKKTMFIKNFIRLVENDDRDVDPNCNFEDNYKSWLHVLYFYLGSHYTISNQFDKGAQAFEKSMQLGKLANPQPLKHCPVYFEAMAGFGYCLSNIYTPRISKTSMVDAHLTQQEQVDQLCDESLKKYQRVPENSYHRWNVDDLGRKTKEVFLQYLKEAPECDGKYPNCHYHLALVYFMEKNFTEAREWKAKGEDAEEKRLPFIRDKKVGSKDVLDFLNLLPTPDIKKCGYMECPNVKVKKLNSCPCKKVSYCGSDCQRKDWKEHKKYCTSKKSKKDK